MELEIVTGRNLSQSQQAEIRAFIDSQDTSHPFQFPEWTIFGGTAEETAIFCLFRENLILRAFASCSIQHPVGTRVPAQVLIVNRGPVADNLETWSEALTLLAEEAKKRKLIYIDSSPERTEGSSPPYPRNWTSLGPSRISLRLDLSPADAEIFSGFRKVTRYEIRRAEKLGLCTSPSVSPEQDEQFLELYFRVADRKGFVPDPRNFMREVLAWLRSQPDRGILLVLEHNGNFIAGAVVLRAGRRCWYVWGANEEQKEFSAGHLLQWHAIRWAKSQGCTEYDFGGYTPGAKSGPAWFKEGFGGKVVHFVAPRRLVLREPQYRLLQFATKTKEKLQRARGA